MSSVVLESHVRVTRYASDFTPAGRREKETQKDFYNKKGKKERRRSEGRGPAPGWLGRMHSQVEESQRYLEKEKASSTGEREGRKRVYHSRREIKEKGCRSAKRAGIMKSRGRTPRKRPYPRGGVVGFPSATAWGQARETKKMEGDGGVGRMARGQAIRQADRERLPS